MAQEQDGTEEGSEAERGEEQRLESFEEEGVGEDTQDQSSLPENRRGIAQRELDAEESDANTGTSNGDFWSSIPDVQERRRIAAQLRAMKRSVEDWTTNLRYQRRTVEDCLEAFDGVASELGELDSRIALMRRQAGMVN
ncbi:hypothetical protein VNI00_018093 [Paramarasmius palmivorus]|uniref:Biogenesis of lysosome-related organelles complex 1 subunit 3 n=1 Tax=Paramarasmius palmivorus TaxID=297713 RepID=A0AAW0B0B9_9AGAR